MSRNYWLPIFTVIGCLTLTGWAGGHGGGKGHYYKQQATSSQSATPTKQFPTLQNPSDAVDIKAPCDTSVSDYNSDLCQQWRMAEAADQMVKVSWGQIALTALSLFGLAVTIFVTTRSNLIAREIGEAQVRAYVNLVDVEIKSYSEERTAAIAIYCGDIPNEVILLFKNSGQSPAINTKVRFRRKTVGKFILETFDQNLEGAEYSPPGVFPAGHHFSRNASTILTSDEYNGIIAGDMHDVIFGEITYEDVFGKKLPPVSFRVLGRELSTERRKFSPF